MYEQKYISNCGRIRMYLGDDSVILNSGMRWDKAITDCVYGQKAARPSKKPDHAIQNNRSKISIKRNEYKHKSWDDNTESPEYFEVLLSVTDHQIIWGVNNYKFDFPSKGRLVWDKMNGDSDQYGCEIAYVSMNNRTDIVRYLWSGMMQGIYCGTDARKALIQQGNKKLNEKRFHPTQKPLPLCKYLIDKYVSDGESIFDGRGGYGNICIAVHQANMIDGKNLTIDWVEKDSEYFAYAVRNFISNENQLTLFQ